MALSKEFLKKEIEKCKIAIQSLEDGLSLHKLMLNAFETELPRSK